MKVPTSHRRTLNARPALSALLTTSNSASIATSFSPDDLRRWIVQLCEALHYAHTGPKVVHRDLKPSNLMIGKDGQLKITDFGIASVIADSMSRVTQVHGVSGTLAYMSPQQALGE